MNIENAAAEIAEALVSVLSSPNEPDSNLEPANVADGLFAVSRAIIRAAELLGTNGAASPMGAIEALAKEVRDAGTSVSCAIRALAEAIESR